MSILAESAAETYGAQSLECSDGNTVVYDGPLEMWPPIHTYRDLTVTATDDEPGNTVTLMTTGTHDEYAEDGTEMNGAGNTPTATSPTPRPVACRPAGHDDDVPPGARRALGPWRRPY